jgi:hypothetical protein
MGRRRPTVRSKLGCLTVIVARQVFIYPDGNPSRVANCGLAWWVAYH